MVGRRLSGLLGLSPAETTLLRRRARIALGRPACAVRVIAFLIATLPVLRALLPVKLRRAAIRPLVYALLPGPSENLLYAGIRIRAELDLHG